MLYSGFVTEVFYVLFYNQVALWMIPVPPLLSTFNKQLQVVLSCCLAKINDLGNGILPVQLTVQNKIINT